jgi:hypothetical protein
MDIVTIVLGLIKVAAEIFQDERKDRFLKAYVKLEKEWMDDAKLLAKLVVAESSNRK